MSTSQDKNHDGNSNIASPSENKKDSNANVKLVLRNKKKSTHEDITLAGHQNGNNYTKSRNKNHERKKQPSDNC